MKSQFLRMFESVIGSRKAAAVVASVILNLAIVASLRFGVTLDDETQASIVSAASNITNAVIVYVMAQGGVDIVRETKKAAETPGGQNGSVY